MKAAPERLEVNVSYYVTNVTAALEDDTSVKSGKSEESVRDISKHSGRPVLGDIVRDYCEEAGTVAVASELLLALNLVSSLTCLAAACGPDSFNLDVGNAISECELAILSHASACSEVYLHRDTYTYVHEFPSLAQNCHLMSLQMVMTRKQMNVCVSTGPWCTRLRTACMSTIGG